MHPYADEDVLAMAVLAKSCMTTVGRYSPHSAVSGTQPGVLPYQTTTASNLEDAEAGIFSRQISRLREIAIGEMSQ